MAVTEFPRIPQAPSDFTPEQRRVWNELVRILENHFRNERDKYRENIIEERTQLFKGTGTIGDNSIIIANPVDASFTLTLPDVAQAKGRIYYIKNVDTSGNSVTVTARGTQLIDGSTTQVITSYDTMKIVSDGTDWWII